MTEREVTIEAGGTLAGSLLLPEGSAHCPGLLIVPGSGASDRDGNVRAGPALTLVNDSLRMLAHGLASHGIASLRIDKRGVGGSQAALPAEEALRFHHNVDDALAWLERLAAEPRIGALFAAGHSEGSAVVTLAALRRPLSGLVLLCGPGEPAGRLLRRQLARQPMTPAALAECLRILDELQAARLVPDVPSVFGPMFRPSVQPYLVSWLAIDPAAALAGVAAPILVAAGDRDLQVGVADAEQLAAAGRTRPCVITGMNHVLKLVPADEAANRAAYADPDLPVAPALLDAIARFVLAQREVNQA